MYADACNLLGDPDRLRHEYRILAEHREAERRPFDEIERTTLQSVSLLAPNAWRSTAELPTSAEPPRSGADLS